MNPRDSPRSRSKGRWSQRRPLVAVLLAVDTSLLTSTPAERLATGYPAPIPAQRLATSDPPPIPAQRLATSGIQLVSSDTAGIGHQSLVSTTINSTTSVVSRHTPWGQPVASRVPVTCLLTSTPAERLATSDPPPIPAQRLVTSDPAPTPAERLVTSVIQLVSSDTAGIGHKPLESTTINSTSGKLNTSNPPSTPGICRRHQTSDVDTRDMPSTPDF